MIETLEAAVLLINKVPVEFWEPPLLKANMARLKLLSFIFPPHIAFPVKARGKW